MTGGLLGSWGLAQGPARLPARPHCRQQEQKQQEEGGPVGQQQPCGGGRLVGEQGDRQHARFPWTRYWNVSPFLGAAFRRREEPTRGHRDAGNWPLAEMRTQGCSCAAQGTNWPRERAFSGHERDAAMVLGTVPIPPWDPYSHRHSTQPAKHTCLPPTPSAPSLHPAAADLSTSPYTHYCLGQASIDTPSTPWELNDPPCRWKSYTTVSCGVFLPPG